MKKWGRVVLKKSKFTEYALVTLGVAIVAAAVYFFMLPSDVAVGSVSALANVLQHFIPLSVSVLTFIMNLVLWIIGTVVLGWDFGRKTAYGSVMLPVFLGILEVIFPDFQSLTQEPLLDVICYILVVSVGLAILYSRNASTGGLEVVAFLMNRYLHINQGQAFSICGMAVALSSALCFDTKTVVLSVLGTYFGGILMDHFIFGMNIKRKVCIISDRWEEMVDFILHEMHSGASLYDVTGAYENRARREINVIVDKQEYPVLMEYVRNTDPGAFVTVYAVNEIRYVPKK